MFASVGLLVMFWSLPAVAKGTPRETPRSVTAATSRTVAVTMPARARGQSTAPPTGVARLGFVLTSSRPQALASYAKAVSTKGSPYYHRFLSPAEVAHEFGPSQAVVHHDIQALRTLRYRNVRRKGWIIYATATAATVDRTLQTTMVTARYQDQTVLAPSTRPMVPADLRGVAWITGLDRILRADSSRTVHSASPVRITHAHAVCGGPEPVTPSGRRPALTDSYHDQVAVVGPASVPTGLPVTVQLTLTSPDGQPDLSATTGQYNLVRYPPNGNTSGITTIGPDAQGHIVSTFTAYQPGTYQLSVQVTPAPGLPRMTVALPTVTFVGGPALPGPATPAQANEALGASGLVAASSAHPATIGLYAEKTPDMADVTGFEQQYNLAPLTVYNVAVDGGVQVNATANSELTMDLQSIAMTAPGASVYLYEVPQSVYGDSILNAINATATNDLVSVLSISYAESESNNSFLQAFQTAVEAANVEGITIVASAGDRGAYGYPAGQSLPLSPSVTAPADIPQVTVVGGVDFRVAPSGNGLETSYWGGDTYAGLDTGTLQATVVQSGVAGNVIGGGGYSTVFDEPSWQYPVLPTPPPGEVYGRGTPDIALPASGGYPGIGPMSGGTSMAAPLFAGYLADMAAQSGSTFGNINPSLYQAAEQDPEVMTQALYGYDGYWTLTPGTWNPLTGLGTPNIDALYQVLTGQTVVDPNPVAVRFVGPPSDVVAGKPFSLGVTMLTATGSPVQVPVTATLRVAGPQNRTISAAVAPGQPVTEVPLELTKAGYYTVTVQDHSDATIDASVGLTVLPGPAAHIQFADPHRYVPGKIFTVRLTAYDAFENVDTRVRGFVEWSWKLDGRIYHARSSFARGVALGHFRVPRTAKGTLWTSYRDSYSQ